ncbi:MAG: DUF2017 domain-containing protein [Pseudonocardiales bacterium]|nr:DUF2017 domain-containing protein [Pseudonocardiales bacterium]MBV9032195.1 DUF2017 domain-containing protein [Pseudonocardiales bacterium]
MNGWRRRGGLVVTALSEREAGLLRGLVGQVRDMLAARVAATPPDELAELTGITVGPTTAPTDRVLARLLPDFHREDATLSGGLRALHEPELVAVKDGVAGVVLDTCPARGGRVRLSDEQAQAWLSALNDVRLALGTVLEVTEDMPDELPPEDPRAAHLVVYHWLTWVQESLIQALAGP